VKNRGSLLTHPVYSLPRKIQAIPSTITSSSADSPLCSSITPSLFHSRLKTYTCFTNPTPVGSLLPLRLPPRTIAQTVFWATRFFFVPCARWSRSSHLLIAGKYTVDRIVYRICLHRSQERVWSVILTVVSKRRHVTVAYILHGNISATVQDRNVVKDA